MRIDRRNGEGILFLTDEDLEFVNVDPKKVSDKDWVNILDYLREYYNDNFTDVLTEAVKHVLTHPDEEKD